MSTLLLAAVLATASVLVSTSGAAAQDAPDDTEARRAFRVAEAHYDNGEFEEAAAGFEEAYRLSGRPQLLYNLYLAYRDAQDTPRAIEALARYLERVPDAPLHDQLRARLERMRAAVAEEGDPVAAQPEPQPPPDDRIDEAGSGTSLPIPALVVAGAGALLLAGGAVTGVMTASKQSELEEGCPTRMGCDPALEDTRDSGEALALVTDVLLVTGIAAVAVGATLLVLGQGERSDGPTASVGCGLDGCAGSVGVGF